MDIDLAEFLYSASGVAALGLVVFLGWRRHENFSSDAIFTDPKALSIGKLRSLVNYARLVMKNNAADSEKHIDAARRLAAAQAEQVRRYRELGLDDTAAK